MSDRLSADAGWTWRWPSNTRKAHAYRENGEAACGAWVLFDPPALQSQTIQEDPGPDDCVRCWRRVDKDLKKLEATND